MAPPPAEDGAETAGTLGPSTLRDVSRLVALLIAACLVSACTPGASTSRGELGSGTDEITPEPTVSIEEISAPTSVVIAPTAVPDGPRPFVIATLLGETGVLAPIDGPAVAGVVAEIERLNDEGGVLGRPVELRRFDMNSRASLSERIARQLVDDPPDLIITSCDTELSEAMLEKAEENGLLTISPCADDVRYLTGGLGPRNFTLGAPAEPEGALAAAVAIERYGPTAIVLRDVTSPEALAFCDGFERAFRELGGSVTYRDEFSYDTLEPVEDRLSEGAEQSSFITLCSHVPGGIDAAPSIILLLRRLGFQAPIVAGSSVDEPGWFSDVPTLGEMLFISWSSTFGNDPDTRVNDLVRRVQQNGETPGAGVSTILGAEAVEAWARAVESAGTDSVDQVASALASFNDEQFSTGQISFVTGARMDLGRTHRVLRVLDGELTVLSLEQTPN